MGKILKNSDSRNIEVHSFTTFKTVEKGIKPFSAQIFSKVEEGTKNFEFKSLVKPKKKVIPVVQETSKTEEPVKEEIDENVITKDKHEEILQAEKAEVKKSAFDEGYKSGLEEAKLKYEKAYEVERKDYLDKIDSQMKNAIKELAEIKETIQSFDEGLPSIVLGFVKEIIGTERKINDNIIVSFIKEGLTRIREMEDITLIINPVDEDIVTENFKEYKIETEVSMIVGSFKVKTRVGTIDFSIKTMIANLEKSINEKFTTSKDN